MDGTVEMMKTQHDEIYQLEESYKAVVLTKERQRERMEYDEARGLMKYEVYSYDVNESLVRCQDPWVKFNTSCYFFGDKLTATSWNASKKFCEDQNSYLVEINNPEEDEFISVKVNRLFPQINRTIESQSFWMGANDLQQDRVWRWSHSNQELSYENWLPGEPNNYLNIGEHCLALFNMMNFTWCDMVCANKFHMICEKS